MARESAPRRGAGERGNGGDGRPARPRNRPRRARVPAVIALAAVLAALVAGLVIGYAAAGDPPPGGLVTQERTVPVVTVTVTEAPPD